MFYIAYGSNMDLGQMRWRCPHAQYIMPIELRDWRLMFKGSRTGSYATIEREEPCVTPALLWEITNLDEQSLDYYEGFPAFYYKEYINVPCYGTGMVYIMHEDRPFGKPTVQYYDLLDRAYKRFGFDRKILKEALRFSTKNQNIKVK